MERKKYFLRCPSIANCLILLFIDFFLALKLVFCILYLFNLNSITLIQIILYFVLVVINLIVYI